MKIVNLIFPHQLFEEHSFHHNGHAIFLVEEYLFFKEFKFHKIKLAYHRASMRYYAEKLGKKGLDITYIASTENRSDIRKLIKELADQGVEKIHAIDPTDNWLEKRLKETASACHLVLEMHINNLFINQRDELLSGFFKPSKKSFFQTSFYKKERVKRDILIEGKDEPVGEKWSYDDENREKYPKDKTPPTVSFPDKDEYWKEAVNYVSKNFDSNPGKLPQSPIYPYTHKSALDWQEKFFEQRFVGFGNYEDAIVKNESFLHHSVLSPMINIGLLNPLEVVREAVGYGEKHKVPINNVEGFVRQIIGWREFIRGMYESKGVKSRTSNFWGFERKIPDSFYDGTTGIEPVDVTIRKVLDTGYCHHIERLMILGNFMLLCEFHPKEVYRWFMELFIDAYDWVMVPNVYGMSQFADGGFFATKPYISSSNYIKKMSNYKKGEWEKPWDGLFWRFMSVNREFFEGNARLGMLLRSLDKMSDEKKEAHLNAAEEFLEGLG